jgi:hypothetical protein
MKRLKTLGLTLVAVFALAAVSASAASAALPELVNKGGTEVKGEITGKSKAETETTLETANGTTVKCKTAKSTAGKAKGTKETTGTKVLFTGCVESVFKGKCNSAGKAAGEIETNALKTLMGYVVGSEKKEVGLELSPETGETFVTFECVGGFLKIEAKGHVIGLLGKGEFKKLTKSLSLVFAKGATKGSQKLTEIEGGTKNAHLESSLNKGTFENSNQQGEGVVEYAEEVELKA